MKWQDIKKAFAEPLARVDASWYPIVEDALNTLNPEYMAYLLCQQQVLLPRPSDWFAAFSLPLSHTRYVFLGESPYPRASSANGYSFWDAAVEGLWGPQGFSSAVNRATSLRHLMKLWLYARGDLVDDFSKIAVQRLDKAGYCQTLEEVFKRLLGEGFLLLNASLMYEKNKINYHAKQCQPFLNHILTVLNQRLPSVQLILLGKIALKCPVPQGMSVLIAEHPYNLSFITHPKMMEFFKPFDILGVR